MSNMFGGRVYYINVSDLCVWPNSSPNGQRFALVNGADSNIGWTVFWLFRCNCKYFFVKKQTKFVKTNKRWKLEVLERNVQQMAASTS